MPVTELTLKAPSVCESQFTEFVRELKNSSTKHNKAFLSEHDFGAVFRANASQTVYPALNCAELSHKQKIQGVSKSPLLGWRLSKKYACLKTS